MGLVTSITVLPARLAAPALSKALEAAVPLTASTTTSPNLAASATLPIFAFGLALAKSASFPASRVPTDTSWPCFRKPAANVFATSPDPMIPIFIFVTPWVSYAPNHLGTT